jgi:hypothetical protein
MSEEKTKKLRNIDNPLTEDEKSFIRTHAMLPEWTDEKIAKELNRSPLTVMKWRKKFGLKRGAANLVQAKQDNNVSADVINNSMLSDEEKVDLWKGKFYTTIMYRQLTQQLSAGDLEYFADQWSRYHLQFTDLKPSEEKLVESLITIELRIKDNRKSYKESQEHEEYLRNALGNNAEAALDLESEEDRFKYELIQSNKRIAFELNKQLQELNNQAEKYIRALNATREQREMKEKIGEDSFFGFVNRITDTNHRKAAGEYNEKVRMATQKKKDSFKEPHKFVNNEYDRILLDGKDFIKGKKSE